MTDNHQNFVCLFETDCSREEIKKMEMGGARMWTGKVHRRVGWKNSRKEITWKT
jgi:hypothetical protein